MATPNVVRPTGLLPALERVVLVLDRPRDATNVGAVVRAMGNFGLARLRLVEPAAFDEARILALAHRGAPVLARLERHATLDAALADCGFVLGTTARARAVRHERLTPREAAPALLRAASTNAEPGTAVAALSHATSNDPPPLSAVLFGPEDRGLSNDALGRCNAVMTIPTTPENPSLNLAQAALLIAYELWLTATDGAVTPRRPDAVAALEDMAPAQEPLARVAAREEMFAALEQVLWGMHPNNDAGRVRHTLARLRAVLLRAAPRSDEVRMLTTLFVHIAHERRAGDGGHSSEPAPFPDS